MGSVSRAEPGRPRHDGLGPDFWRFAAAYSGIALADGVRFAALPLLAASITRSPLAVAAVTAAQSAPWLVANLPSGVFVDRHDRGQIMRWAAALRIGLMVILVATLLGHLVSIGLLIGLGFLLGCADTFGANASVGLVRGLVRAAHLERANGVVGGVNSVGTGLVGPALGSVLFAVADFLPFAADTMAVLIALALLLSLRGGFRAEPSSLPGRSAGIWREMAEGISWLWQHRALRVLALLVAASNLAWGMAQGILVLFVLEVMHLPRAAFGPLIASLALGGLAGAVLGGRFGSRWRTPKMLAGILATEAAALALAGAFPTVGAVVAALVVAGLASAIWDVLVVAFRQRVVPDHLLGRVTSGFRFVGIGAAPVGAVLGGLVAAAGGLRAPFFLGAAVMVLASVAALAYLRSEDLRVAS
ncbi:MAG: MFS transporter [Candidatus Dormibacteria bacterium]